jgi:hypothetical protein
MLAYLGFQSIEDLCIEIHMLKFNSARITVDKNNGVRVFNIEVFCYPQQITQWYIDIPVMILDNKKLIKTSGNVDNTILDNYLVKQTKYLRLFDKLYKNALYLDEKIEVNMDIIDTNTEDIPENEFELLSFTLTSKVKHPTVALQEIGMIIENSVKKRLKEYQISTIIDDTGISEKSFQDTLLLCDMMTI